MMKSKLSMMAAAAATVALLTGTALALFFVPIFFVVIRGRFHGSERQRRLHAQQVHHDMPATAGDPV